MDGDRKRRLLVGLIGHLADERLKRGLPLPCERFGSSVLDSMDVGDLWCVFRALVNTREPWPADPGFLAMQDELLQGMIAEAGVSAVGDATASAADERISMWRGDITTLAADAIVNAANSGMTGCWVPLHNCIDNAIHTFSGVQLRAECSALMERQGHPEPVGHAKVTGSYNLPSGMVVHTVGPAVDGALRDEHRVLLARSYVACLDAAVDAGALSIAFPCVSTGVFGFPQAEAARIAVSTVRDWLGRHPESGMKVVFNVFQDVDERLYADILGIEVGRKSASGGRLS